MTLAEFSRIFALLAVQLRFTDADEATIRGYYEALKDLEPEFCAMAAKRFALQVNSDGEAWFPKTGEWRALATKIEVERTDELKARLRKLRAPLCVACGDTGFERNVETNCVARCSCQKLRRLEILGRRPMPALPEATPGTEQQLMQATDAARALASTRGIR